MDRRLPAHIHVTPCPEADRLHDEDPKSYAHTFHRSGTICLARASFDLPPSHFWAILAHEVGHLLAGEDGSEADADHYAEDFFQITITYTDSKHGPDLQMVSPQDAMKIQRYPFIY